jgi:starch phosphorylase
MSKDSHFLKLYEKVMEQFQKALGTKENLWWSQKYPKLDNNVSVAYLSMEYGIHNSLRIYSGGLGVLSGDHLKESSDLGVPLIAVGFLYQEGYFKQRIPPHGWQEESYLGVNFQNVPIVELIDPSTSKPFIITIYFNDIPVHVRVWLVEVGRVKLYLLDSNIEENPAWDRELTARLYGGQSELRLKQEKILGFGAVILFDKLGIKPTIWHLNEGHCSFSSIERIRKLMKKNSFEKSLQIVRNSTHFTTHTPVPAGHDVFPFSLIETYFANIINEIGRENFFSLGTFEMNGNHGYNMSVLGLRTSCCHNGVSKLHGEVASEMFTKLWKEEQEKYKEGFNPLEYVTNGAHVPSFTSRTIKELFNMVIDDWIDHHDENKTWDAIFDTLTDNDIWEYHSTAKRRLFRYMDNTARNKLQSREWNSDQVIANGALLDRSFLTIGFARRFATYKRSTLLFHDPDRLKKILNDPYKPVQIIFAGKAHPADDPGKKFIQEIFQKALNPDFGFRIAFLENYDLVTAKYLTQGVDVWLNNPLRPNEASGTSGMKAAINFVPNLSILDGWWAEAFNKNEPNGWAINEGMESGNSLHEQNHIDANSLYDILENEVVPTYYGIQSGDNIPRDWVKIMRNSVKIAMTNFSSRRMIKDYCNLFYSKLIEKNII